MHTTSKIRKIENPRPLVSSRRFCLPSRPVSSRVLARTSYSATNAQDKAKNRNSELASTRRDRSIPTNARWTWRSSMKDFWQKFPGSRNPPKVAHTWRVLHQSDPAGIESNGESFGVHENQENALREESLSKIGDGFLTTQPPRSQRDNRTKGYERILGHIRTLCQRNPKSLTDRGRYSQAQPPTRRQRETHRSTATPANRWHEKSRSGRRVYVPWEAQED